MSRIVGAYVRKRATTSPVEAQAYARTWGKATGRVRAVEGGFVIGKTTGRKREVSSDLCVYVE
jgi:hypothetical protein